MLIQTLEQKVNTFFDRLIARYNGWLPFKGLYLNRVRKLCLDNLDKCKAAFEVMFEQDWDKGVDWLIFLLKGNLKIAGVPGFLVAMVLDMVGNWLKANKDLFKDQIGSPARA